MFRSVSIIFATAASLTMTAAASAEDLPTKLTLNLSVSKKIAAAAEEYAAKNKWNVVIAIVDDGGHLIYLQRMDGVQTGSIEVAQRKAKSAAAFKRPGHEFGAAVEGGRNALLALPGAMPFDGGYPLKVDGEVIGAIGVSGVTGSQDGLIAKTGSQSLAKILAP